MSFAYKTIGTGIIGSAVLVALLPVGDNQAIRDTTFFGTCLLIGLTAGLIVKARKPLAGAISAMVAGVLTPFGSRLVYDFDLPPLDLLDPSIALQIVLPFGLLIGLGAVGGFISHVICGVKDDQQRPA
jgi:hypothetical protein